MGNAEYIDWLEVITEHYIQTVPEQAARARQLRSHFPLIPHGIEMSIGSENEVDPAYVNAITEFTKTIEAPWFSDHLSFTQADNIALGQLTPVLRTAQNAEMIGRRARAVQERVGLPFLLENITYYLDVESELTESEFITAVVQQADCGLLLDLTNIYINSVNHGFDPFDFLAQLPLERVLQVHLAGGEWQGSIMIDSHAHPVNEEVWCLLEFVLSRSPVKGILIERDQNFQDDFSDLREDLVRGRQMLAKSAEA